MFLEGIITAAGYDNVFGAIKHPQAPQKNKWSLRNLFFEERSGGVAAIDPPPQNGNERSLRSEVQGCERETAGKKLTAAL